MDCPTCAKVIKPREENKAFPFCSERCRMADLGRWLNEEYRIPVVEPHDNDGTGAVPATDEDEGT